MHIHFPENTPFPAPQHIDVTISNITKIKVVFCSASRNDTSYEIIDHLGNSVSYRRIRYATGRMNSVLVEELNILLEEFGKSISTEDFAKVTTYAINHCEGLFGNGNEDGDVIVTIN